MGGGEMGLGERRWVRGDGGWGMRRSREKGGDS